MYNNEHYRDPTAFKAMENMDAKRVRRVVKNIKLYINENDLELLNRIELKDKRTGKIYK